jgi:hypothetical protein
VTTDIAFLERVIADPAFPATGFITQHASDLLRPREPRR